MAAPAGQRGHDAGVPLAAQQLAYKGYAHTKASRYLYLSAPGTAHAHPLH